MVRLLLGGVAVLAVVEAMLRLARGCAWGRIVVLLAKDLYAWGRTVVKDLRGVASVLSVVHLQIEWRGVIRMILRFGGANRPTGGRVRLSPAAMDVVGP